MPPKNKKNKRKIIKLRHENEEKTIKTIDDAKHSVKCSENFSDFFKNTEVDELKNMLKLDDLSGIPLIMGASILNKTELLKILLKQGFNVNETGSHHTTALIWAVKCKHLQIIDLLLSRGADPTIKSDTGDHVLLVALESKLWDEESFLTLWNNVKNVTFIDVDYKSKCGHSMLHIAVRREWKSFIDILVTEKANMNITNKNGITPLMLACFRNNEHIVKLLIKAGADVLKEDEKGCISLCYAISSSVLRNEKPPFTVIEEIVTELKRKGMSLKDYLKKCTKMISNPLKKYDVTAQSTADIILHVISFAVFHMTDGLKILLELDIFNIITNSITKFENDLKQLCALLAIVNELVSYSECYNNFSQNIEKMVMESFFISGCAMACLLIFKKYVNIEHSQVISLAAFPIILTCLYSDLGQEWLQNNYFDILPYSEKILEAAVIPTTYRSEYNKKMARKKIGNFKEYMNKLKTKFVHDCDDVLHHDSAENINDYLDDVRDTKFCSKKTKRRSKALKAKIAKIKSADLAQRLNLSGKKQNEHKRSTCLSQTNIDSLEMESECKIKTANETLLRKVISEETEIVTSIKVMLRKLQLQCEQEETLRDLNENDSKYNMDQVYSNELQENESNTKLEADMFRTCLQSTLHYFSALLQKIIEEYKKNWKNDREFGYNIIRRGQGDSSNKPNETTECWKSNLESLEKKYIEHLETEFEKLLVCIKEQAQNDPEICRIALSKLEILLTNHKIRGKTITLENDIMTNVKPVPSQNIDNNPQEKDFIYTNYFEYNRPLDNIQFTVDELGNENYAINYNEETQDMLYYREMMALPNAKKVNQGKAAEMRNKTLADAYHLIPSIMAICDSDNEYDLEENAQSEDCTIDMMTISSNSSTNIKNQKPKAEYSSVIMQALTKCAENNVIVGGAKSRWSDLISSLQDLSNCQILFSGDLRISSGSKRYNYVISTGGNFNPVELGLDINNRPLAVKRIPKESSVCKTLKTLLNPLMGIRNSYILHYFICDYEGNDLIFATPLCEFNIGQYVMLLKQMPNVRLSANEAVKQFLSGLMYLHTQKEPIVHGNLKPSNIFVDIHGSVRVAEFGIHKALFKLNEAPDSSIIWFAPETYKTFKETLVMDCTCASDIQVAGMLVHFILTGGKHPYGDETKEIVKNLEKATPQLITHDVDLQDLITWMLLFDPNERPVIKQVLTHVYFWSTERKWCFILSCAGISSHGSSLPIEINAFHDSIDKIAIKENIKGCWVKVIKQKFPELACISDDDTPTGLLRFIRSCIEKKTCLDMNNEELCRYVLSAFPAFPLSLYRMLESSSWLKHPILTSFTMVDSIFS